MRSWLSSVIRVEHRDPEVARRAQTLNAILLAAIPCALVTAVIVFPWSSGAVSALFLVLAAVVCCLLIWLCRRDHVTTAVVLFAATLFVVTVGQPLTTGDLSTNPLAIPLGTVMLLYVCSAQTVVPGPGMDRGGAGGAAAGNQR